MRYVKTFPLRHGEETTLDANVGAEVLSVGGGAFVRVLLDDTKPVTKLRLFSAAEGRPLPDWASKPSYIGSYEVVLPAAVVLLCHVFRMPGV